MPYSGWTVFECTCLQAEHRQRRRRLRPRRWQRRSEVVGVRRGASCTSTSGQQRNDEYGVARWGGVISRSAGDDSNSSQSNTARTRRAIPAFIRCDIGYAPPRARSVSGGGQIACAPRAPSCSDHGCGRATGAPSSSLALASDRSVSSAAPHPVTPQTVHRSRRVAPPMSNGRNQQHKSALTIYRPGIMTTI